MMSCIVLRLVLYWDVLAAAKMNLWNDRFIIHIISKWKQLLDVRDVATFSGSSWDRVADPEAGKEGGRLMGRPTWAPSRHLRAHLEQRAHESHFGCIIALVDVLFRSPSNFRGDAVGCSRECVLATGTTAWSHLFGQALGTFGIRLFKYWVEK